MLLYTVGSFVSPELCALSPDRWLKKIKARVHCHLKFHLTPSISWSLLLKNGRPWQFTNNWQIALTASLQKFNWQRAKKTPIEYVVGGNRLNSILDIEINDLCYETTRGLADLLSPMPINNIRTNIYSSHTHAVSNLVNPLKPTVNQSAKPNPWHPWLWLLRSSMLRLF